jgi:hypothetical protein
VTKLIPTASVIVALGGLGLFLSSSCGGDSPQAVVDNATGGSAGGGAESDGATSTGGGAGASASSDASAGSGGSSTDLDATVFVDGMLEIPDGSFATGDATLDDDAGDPPLEDAGAPPSDGGVVAKTFGIYCYGPNDRLRKACTGPVTDCCYDSDTSTGTCTSATLKCPTTAGMYRCDGPEDCSVGQVCCAAVSTLPLLKGSPNHEYSTNCTASCGKGFVAKDTAYAVVCKKAADCTSVQTCRAVVNMPGLGICSALVLTL